ncbi:synaptic vesicle membrane protein VAT-1 homolog [Palaemon carinicauda]|uniref:synaptic vesicle membrane protein VAT-1 homolog n=1 Tax=Palaemon carinicauda TaxID=392227 RepID=UPI0035B65CC3
MVRRIVVKAIGGFEQLQVEEGPAAHEPKSKEVTVVVKACGLNFYDLYVRQGLSPEIQPPCTLGLECSGLVKAVGNEVTSVKVGDKVSVHCPKGGACVEEITVDEDSVILVPNHISFDKAASFTVNYLTAYFSLFHVGGLREGGAVLIHSAAGGVGWAATQLAKTVSNVTVFGTASPHKHELIRQNGVDYPISHDERYSDIVREHRKEGVSIVLDSLSGADFTHSQQLLEPLGKVVLIGARGMLGEETRSMWRILKTWWMTKDISPYTLIVNNCGVAGFNLNELRYTSLQTFRKGWKEVLQKILSNELSPRIDSVWTFNDIVDASKQIANRKNVGKVIIKP